MLKVPLLIALIAGFYFLYPFAVARAVHRGLERARNPEARATPMAPGVFFRQGFRSAVPWWLRGLWVLPVPLGIAEVFRTAPSQQIALVVVLFALAAIMLLSAVAVLFLAPRWRNTWGVAAVSLLLGLVGFGGLCVLFHLVLPDRWLVYTVRTIHPSGYSAVGYNMEPLHALLAAAGILAAQVLRIRFSSSPRWYRLPEE